MIRPTNTGSLLNSSNTTHMKLPSGPTQLSKFSQFWILVISNLAFAFLAYGTIFEILQILATKTLLTPLKKKRHPNRLFFFSFLFQWWIRIPRRVLSAISKRTLRPNWHFFCHFTPPTL